MVVCVVVVPVVEVAVLLVLLLLLLAVVVVDVGVRVVLVRLLVLLVVLVLVVVEVVLVVLVAVIVVVMHNDRCRKPEAPRQACVALLATWSKKGADHNRSVAGTEAKATPRRPLGPPTKWQAARTPETKAAATKAAIVRLRTGAVVTPGCCATAV